MAPTVAPRHRYGDDPSPRDLAEIGVLLDRHREPPERGVRIAQVPEDDPLALPVSDLAGDRERRLVLLDRLREGHP